MYKNGYLSLYPVGSRVQHAWIKSAEICPTAAQQHWSSRCACFFLMLQSCRSPLPILLLSGATQTVKCWHTASSILFNAHRYFVIVRRRGGAECPSEKWLRHLEGGERAGWTQGSRCSPVRKELPGVIRSEYSRITQRKKSQVTCCSDCRFTLNGFKCCPNFFG